ncbi:enoyl-CoA hydratase/isomerase family protein [Alkalihalobacillus sp. BA299]|uniref:enoyl-CoA hydratase/isomerase family protein n=1 Tax=Alkalihalobacillus sp. BA299 TaxID=2815938 RepID=UPI001ADBB98A|nr:enoyl-CoA hydratase/isomerase family protein [Alkalihalobacillus sp. BA299]
MGELVIRKIQNQIGHIILNRPEKLNALSRELVQEINDCLDDYSKNPEVKVIVLSGNGKAFCAGGDIETMQNITHASEAAKWVEHASSLSKKLMETDKYVIAAVHGYAAGAGFSIALASDFIVASHEAKFALSFTNIGLIPDLGLIKSLSERLNPPIVKEWISAGKVIQAQEALSHDLINRVAEGDVVEAAESFAQFIVNGPVVANKYVKYLVNNAPNLHHETAFLQENVIQAILLQTEDHKEGVSAFYEKRNAQFIGL